MKRLLLGIIAVLMIALPVMVQAAGSCTQNPAQYTGGFVKVAFVCTGDAANGSVPDTAFSAANMALILGTHYLMSVTTYPTADGTAPDAADVQLTMYGMDLLGGKGVNLIHATNTQDTLPYSTFMGMYRYPGIVGTLTQKVANQATASADFTIEYLFVR